MSNKPSKRTTGPADQRTELTKHTTLTTRTKQTDLKSTPSPDHVLKELTHLRNSMRQKKFVFSLRQQASSVSAVPSAPLSRSSLTVSTMKVRSTTLPELCLTALVTLSGVHIKLVRISIVRITIVRITIVRITCVHIAHVQFTSVCKQRVHLANVHTSTGGTITTCTIRKRTGGP